MVSQDRLACLNKIIGNSENTPIIDFQNFVEKNDYNACSFVLGEAKIIYREAKVTPKKIGLFVAIWKRNEQGITAPYHEDDSFDFMVIAVTDQETNGLFVFPKNVLSTLGIISTSRKEGKRGTRIYPKVENGMNKQALTTYNKQHNYYYSI